MNLLEDIQSTAADSSSSVSTLLRKCKILAARLGNQQLENWMVWESNGYPKDVPVPRYRMWRLQVRGNFLGPYASLSHALIHTVRLPKDVQKNYNEYECRFSIAAIESAVESAMKKNDNRIVLETGGLASVLGKSVYTNMTCIECWAECGAGNFIEVINIVRDRVLDFSLALWDGNPPKDELNLNTQEPFSPDKVTQLVNQTFNTTVHGGTANLLGTANNSSVEFNIELNDFESVRRVLQDSSVSEEDIAELEIAMTEDEPPSSPDQFGSKVSSWIAKMMKKASEGTWNVGISVAGNLLSQTLSKYYGL